MKWEIDYLLDGVKVAEAKSASKGELDNNDEEDSRIDIFFLYFY